MAEASDVSSELPTEVKVQTEPRKENRNQLNQRSSQSKNNSRSRQENHKRNPKLKPKQDQSETDGTIKNDVDTRLKKRSKPKSRQSARPEPRKFGETDSLEFKANVKPRTEARGGEPSFAETKGCSNIATNDNKPHSGRRHQFDKYSKSKQVSKFSRNGEVDVSTSPTQPSSLMTTDNQRPTSHGIVSNGIYIPNNKLRNNRQHCKDKQSDNSTINSKPTSERERNLHSSKRFDYSSCVGGPTKRSSHEIGKMTRNFQVVSMKSQGLSSVQAGVLIEQLTDEKYECMVCCEVIKCAKAVWSCSNCFHIFHLYCIKRWARSPAAAIEGERVKY